jgi:enoyl-CoA hydratase/carnithine racemase
MDNSHRDCKRAEEIYMADEVLVERADGIMTVTLNMPERRNPCSDLDVVDALVAAMEEADADMDVRVVILTGVGSAFSSGGDVKKMADGTGVNSDKPAQTRRNYKWGIQRLPLTFEKLEVPVIAAVNGPAVGAGCDLACMCDIRIAGESARFAESFVKVGIVPGDGGAWLLPRVVGFSKATEMALTGDPIDAQEALRFGLVSKVVPDAELMDAARDMAQRIAANPPHAVRLTRRLMRQAYTTTLDNVLEMSAAIQSVAHTTSDHKEAVASFIERRKPIYKGE